MRKALAFTRVTIGLIQGTTLYLLYNAFDAKTWPATDGVVFAALLLVVVFIPVIAIGGSGNLRLRTFMAWTLAATAILAGLAAYDIVRTSSAIGISSGTPRNVPQAALWVASAAGLFIAHVLVVSGDADRRFVADYRTYFDVASKHGVQIVLAGLFVGAFWAVSLLGAGLFKLIKIDYLVELIQKPWIAIPATTLTFAYAVHATDVHIGIVRGVRALGLTLLSWLLPMMAAIAIAFLAALAFTGFEPLWSTRWATSVLLFAAASLVVLINAAYQDGDPAHRVARMLRCAGLAAAASLTPLVAIAAYAIALRVEQYGWTPQRIIAFACVVVAVCHAFGYALAAVVRGPWMKRIEATNIFTAFVILAVMLALFSPVADPARIATADQVARLESGRISPDKFDYAFLRFRSGRYGLEALDRLRMKQDGPDAMRIAEKANAALAAKIPFETLAELGDNIAFIYPKGQTLPASFLQQNWDTGPDQWRYPRCMTTSVKCDAMMLDLDGDGMPEILIFGGPYGLTAYKQTDGKWRLLGDVVNSNCKGVREALLAGNFEFVAPEFKELLAAGQHLRVQPACR
jgi:hypothetical protein